MNISLPPQQDSFQEIKLEDNSIDKRIYLFVIMVAICLLSLPTLAFSLYKSNNSPKPGPPITEPTPTQQETIITTAPTIPVTPIPSTVNYISILLLGRGGDNHSGGSLTDSMTQLVFYPTKLKAILIGIPRDTYIEAGQPKRWMKINHSFPESPQNTKLAVEAITGIRVDHYAIVDFTSFTKLIDSLGGITVDIKTAFNDPYYPIKGEENNTCGMSPEQITEVHQKYSGFNLEKQFTCRYENLVFNKGATKMDGATALKYVRSRHSGTYGSDFARLERASDVIIAISQSIIQRLSTTAITSIYNDLKKFIVTDMGLENLMAWKVTSDQIKQSTIKTIPLKADLFSNGVSPLGEFILEPTAGRGGWGPIQQYILTQQ